MGTVSGEFQRTVKTLIIAESGGGTIVEMVNGDPETLEYSREAAVNLGNNFSFTNNPEVIYNPGSYTVGADPGDGGGGDVQPV